MPSNKYLRRICAWGAFPALLTIFALIIILMITRASQVTNTQNAMELLTNPAALEALRVFELLS